MNLIKELEKHRADFIEAFPEEEKNIPQNKVCIGTGRGFKNSLFSNFPVVTCFYGTWKEGPKGGNCSAYYYFVEIGSEAFNDWVSRQSKIKALEGYVCLGHGSEDLLGACGGKEVKGAFFYNQNQNWQKHEKEYECISLKDSSLVYAVKEDSPTFKNLKKHFKKSPQIDSLAKVLDEMEEIRAKIKDGYFFKYNGYTYKNQLKVKVVFEFQKKDFSISLLIDNHLKNHSYCIYMCSYGRSIPIGQCEFIKEENSLSFFIRGHEGEVVKEFVKGEEEKYWKFGCAKISFTLIEGIKNVIKSEREMTIIPDEKLLKTVTIGKGEFTTEQILEMASKQ